MTCKAFESTGASLVPAGYLTKERPDHQLDELLVEVTKPLRSIPFRQHLKEQLMLTVPRSRIYHWVAAGVYYGYPQHCIEAFLARTTIYFTNRGTDEERAYLETNLPEAQPYESVGCIPSEELLSMPLEEGLALINQHRFASWPFVPDAENEPKCADLEALAESDPVFRQRFIDTLNSIFT